MKEDLIRKLAEFEPTEMPVLSIYLDMRPQATGGNPGIRSGEIVLKDRLVSAVRGDRLGVSGLKGTEQALKNGQVATLLLNPNAENLDEKKFTLKNFN